jgi:penicillin-insensitive murein endopeptidase
LAKPATAAPEPSPLLYDEPTQDPPDDDDGGDQAGDASPSPHPLEGVGRDELERMLLEDRAALGPMSVGRPNAGALYNGVRLPRSDGYTVIDPVNAWGTQETIDFIAGAIARVNAEFPGTPKLSIGHISSERGGPLSPHVSHQAGRDVDLGFYYTKPARWFARGTAENLDLPRTWALVRALIAETDVEMILVDHSIQKLLFDHALALGEDEQWLTSVFRGGGGQRPIIRHARGHATHLHVRFFNPVAQNSGRRLLDLLVHHGLVERPTEYVQYRAKKGDTLGKLARRFGTTVDAIKLANRLKSSLIQANKTYRIPRAGAPPTLGAPLVFPARRPPPPRRPVVEVEVDVEVKVEASGPGSG